MPEIKALIREAERRGLWLWCRYDDMWFSPAELRAANAKGQFRWGPVNWELHDPLVQMEWLAKRVVAAQAAVNAFRRRMRKP